MLQRYFADFIIKFCRKIRCKHVICNAHILRELEKAKEDNSLWAVEMQNLLMNLYKKTEKGTSILSKIEAKEWGEQYDLICQMRRDRRAYSCKISELSRTT